SSYDNLNRVISRERYDADQVLPGTLDGVPQPLSPHRRREKVDIQYDDQDRVYQRKIYLVDQTTGALSASTLNTNQWYDRRGLSLKAAPPGGVVTKMAYDGAGRTLTSYVTDGAEQGLDPNWTTWQKAGTVQGDFVLSQTEVQYDGNGNVIFSTTRQRFHDAQAPGPLTTPTGSDPKARVSYVAQYYDAADRLKLTVNLGTNGGTFLSQRPAESAVVRSDQMLVTAYTYGPAGWAQDVSDPRNLTTRTTYDMLGRTLQTIEAYSGTGTPTDFSNRTTAFTYDGAGHLLTLTVVLPTSMQKTQYVYGY